MYIPQSARQHGGVAYREEDRGDGFDAGGGGEDEEAKAAAAKEAEDKAEAARAAEKLEREKNITVPKARLDEAVAKERARAEAAEKRAAEYEAKEKEKAKGVDVEKLRGEIDKLEDELEAKMTEGTPAERKALRAAIREKNEQLSDAKADHKATMATALAIEQVRYDAAVEKLETDYPFLVPGGDDYNDVITKEVLELKGAYEAAGSSSSEALKKAVRVLEPSLKAAKAALKKDDPEAAAKAAEAAKEAAKAAEAKAKGKIDAELEAKRKEEATKKGMEAKEKIPAKAGLTGKVDDKAADPDVKKMSEKDFDKLPEDEKKRLRGD